MATTGPSVYLSYQFDLKATHGGMTEFRPNASESFMTDAPAGWLYGRQVELALLENNCIAAQWVPCMILLNGVSLVNAV